MADETVSSRLLQKAVEEGSAFLPYIKLRDTGKHIVKFLGDKEVKGTNYHTKLEEDQIEYTFKEDKQKKRHRVSAKDKNGELHYFVARMGEMKIGEMLVLEYKKHEGKMGGFISINELNLGSEAGNEGERDDKSSVESFEETEKDINIDDVFG